jgi:hypothetical protein
MKRKIRMMIGRIYIAGINAYGSGVPFKVGEFNIPSATRENPAYAVILRVTIEYRY